MECVHDCPPTAIPQPPPPDVSDHESDSEVQRFIFSILTQRKTQSWQGMPLAMNHAFEIGAFCEAFRPTAVRLNEARTREALYKSSSIAPALQIMFFDIIWAKICELRPDTEQLVERMRGWRNRPFAVDTALHQPLQKHYLNRTRAMEDLQ
jgi:hypothetical protein